MIAVTGHLERERVKRIAERLLSMLRQEGFEAKLFGIASKKLKKNRFGLVLVVGGDGSLLRVARELRKQVPLLGIAAGKRSFLMQVRPRQMAKAVKMIAREKFEIEYRARLAGKADGKRLPLALNEFLVVPKKSGMLISCIVTAGKERKKVEADGLIIATPTGSSGHAFSAGGRRVGLGEKKFIVVPSNPLNRKPKAFTVSSRKRISVKCLAREAAMEVVVDGRARFPLKKKLLVEGGEPALLLKVNGLQ
jgi:NAD+ kinase